MTFEEWAEQNINTNQSAYTAAKAAWQAALLLADDKCELIELEFDRAGKPDKAHGAWACKRAIRSVLNIC